MRPERDVVRLGGGAGAGPERPWRSLERRAEDLAAGGSGRLPERVRPELPPGADLPPDALTRRTVLGLMGASLGLAGLTACRRPAEEIVPYVVQPEEVVPGIPRHYATTLPLGAGALGVVVESHEGRPSKVEGNREHPASGGAASAWAQAAVLDLYDPDRLRGVLRRTAPEVEPTPAAWGDFVAWWQERSAALAGDGGRGLWIVAGAHTGPTLERLAGALAARFPQARWAVHEPAGDQAVYDGVQQATGTAGRPLLDLASVRRLLALDADLFHTESEAVANARGWTAARRAGAEAGGDAAARLYVVEPVPTSTGAIADHRLALPAGQVGAFAAAVAEALGVRAGTATPRQGGTAGEGAGTGEIGTTEERGTEAASAGAEAPSAAGTTTGGDAAAAAPTALSPELRRRAAVIARDLASAQGAALVAAGRRQPPEVHALVTAINQRLGAPVTVAPLPRLAAPGRGAAGAPVDLAALAAALEAGQVDTVVVLDGDPAYSAPADLAFADQLARAPHRVVLAHDANATAEGAEWVLPLAHPFEAWGDARSADGTVSPIQPLIEPLFAGRSAVELVALLASGEERSGYDLVRETWQGQGLAGGGLFEDAWRRALHAGVAAPAAAGAGTEQAARPAGRPLDDGGGPTGDPGSARGEEGAEARAALAAGPAAAGGEEREPERRAADPPAAPPQAAEPAAAPAAPSGFEPPPGRDLEIVFQLSPAVHDGRFANNPWLQELPDPITKLVWGNAALVAPATAAELRLADGDEVLLTVGGRKLLAPVAIQPGQAERTVALALGYGRAAAGRVGRDVGVDAYRLRSAAAPWIDRVALRATGRRHELVRTQEHWEIEGRDLVRFAAPGAAPGFHGAEHEPADEGHEPEVGAHELPQLWESPPLSGEYQWGMAIDLAACVGCNACVAACQAENNIPTVGPEQVSNGREMHWLRVDRYYSGAPDTPDFAFQPVPCMHCENAPCEQVCPVAATVHDAEGLNGMTYNRCIGTRYCSNNCPYKVRRFNFFNYTKDTPEIVQLAMNPDVTVRSRGVMEKCTYCVQRINEVKMRAKRDGDRRVADGEIQTACQQTCPADAIVFGDVSDPATRVSQWKLSGRDYVLLGELNNRPRTSYLARFVNPNPEWGAGA